MGTRSERDLGRLKMQPMTRRACYAVTSTRDDHFGGLKCSIVRRGEPAICRQALERGVGEVALNESSQVIQLLFAGGVPLYLALREQLLPTHPVFLLS